MRILQINLICFNHIACSHIRYLRLEEHFYLSKSGPLFYLNVFVVRNYVFQNKKILVSISARGVWKGGGRGVAGSRPVRRKAVLALVRRS